MKAEYRAKWVTKAKSLFARKQDLNTMLIANMLVERTPGFKTDHLCRDLAEVLSIANKKTHSYANVRSWLIASNNFPKKPKAKTKIIKKSKCRQLEEIKDYSVMFPEMECSKKYLSKSLV